MTTIVKLEAENVKRLKAVQVTPEGSLVIVGGANGSGKTSLLDSIMYALAGADSIPSKPLRNGTDKGHVTVDLGEMTVSRKFNRGQDGEVRSVLEIRSKDGYKAPSPQALLDDLCGKMAFDPLEFSRLKPKQQRDSLKELVGLDFTALDQERDRWFFNRTELNREVKGVQARLESVPTFEGVPAEEVSVADLMAELERRQKTNQDKHDSQQDATIAEQEVFQSTQKVRDILAEIQDLNRQLTLAEEELSEASKEQTSLRERAEAMQTEALAMPSADCDEIHRQLGESDKVNRKVRANAERKSLTRLLETLEAKAKELTGKLSSIETEKQSKMASAPFPVAGLGFDADGVTLNGLPFEQASSAEQLRVSVSMGLAVNPRFRVMLIRDGSLLDPDSMALIAKMAEDAGAQVWIEVVRSDESVSVVIEDGMVVTKPETEPELVAG